MSRYQHIGADYEDISVGDEFMLVHCHRWRDTTYNGPYPVTKVLKTQFKLDDGKGGVNFMRSYGRQVGYSSSSTYAKPATDELLLQRDEAVKAAAEKKSEEQSEAAKHERKMRERYGAQHIEDEDSQKLLAEVRLIAETGRSMVKGFFKDIDSASWKEPYNVMRESERFEKTLKLGLILKDRAEDLHEKMCEIYEAAERGRTIEVTDRYLTVKHNPEEVPRVGLMKAVISTTRRRLETEFFSHRYDDGEEAEWEATFIKRVRDIEDIDHDWPAVRVAKRGEES